jgi:hypothetical protein
VTRDSVWQTSGCTVSGGRVTQEIQSGRRQAAQRRVTGQPGRMWKGAVVTQSEVDFPGETEEIHEQPQ